MVSWMTVEGVVAVVAGVLAVESAVVVVVGVSVKGAVAVSCTPCAAMHCGSADMISNAMDLHISSGYAAESAVFHFCNSTLNPRSGGCDLWGHVPSGPM